MSQTLKRTLLVALLPFAMTKVNPVAAEPVPVIFDTDIESDVDDVGAVAVLHALANRGEAKILAMGVSAKYRWSAPCLDALNTYFGRPDIPIGVVKGAGVSNKSKYCEGIARQFPHDLTTDVDAPDAAQLYRKVLTAQPDGSVVLVSVGFLTNVANLLTSKGDDVSPLSGIELVRKKVRAWVCMGAKHPEGREWNVFKDAGSSIHAVKNWPTAIVWSGFEIGVEVQTGAGLKSLPKSSPVRRAYELYNGVSNRSSWDQTAVLYAVRGWNGGLKELWDEGPKGRFLIRDDGTSVWQDDPNGNQTYLKRKMKPESVSAIIESLMKQQPNQQDAN